jgi:fatty-acyl-CoA synthase
LTEPSLTEQPYLARRQNWNTQLARHALMQPDATALRFLGHTTTWADLGRRVTALAGALSRRGVGFGDRVLILMLNRTESSSRSSRPTSSARSPYRSTSG